MLERAIDRPLRVERALGVGGARVLVSAQRADGTRSYAIANWAQRSTCDLPSDTRAVLDPPPPASESEPLRVPLVRGEGADAALWLADLHCAVDGPLAGIRSATVATIKLGASAQSLLTFRDTADTLYTLDGTGRLHTIAADVHAFQHATVSAAPLEDVLWLHEAGKLTLRALDGTLRVRLGDAVSEFAVFDSLLPRVAYVDGGNVYEASAPSYVPSLRVKDACSVRYGTTTLEFHTPCSEQQLVRVSIGPGDVQTFAKGVYAVRDVGVLRFEYAHGVDGDALFVSSADVERHAITPVLTPDSLSIRDDAHVSGRTEDGRFGVWSLNQRMFQLEFSSVESVSTLAPGTVNEVLLVHHAVDQNGAGTLSTFSTRDRSTRALAHGVPRGGFITDAADALSEDSSASPMLVFIQNAVPVPGLPDTLQGTLRTQQLNGALGTDVTDEVSSFALVASPLPALIVAAESGARAGLWFSAL